MDFANSDALCRYIRMRAKRVILRFSTGKDSLAAWLQLRRFFAPEEIIAVHQAFVPAPSGGETLTFVERTLATYEAFFGAQVVRLVHPHFFAMLAAGLYQSDARAHVLRRLFTSTSIEFSALSRSLDDQLRSNATYVATGFKTSDKPQRAANIAAYGPLHLGTRTFAPVYDWSDARVVEEIRLANLNLPVDYRLWRYSFTTSLTRGFHPRMVAGVQAAFPDDYRTLAFWFPGIASGERRESELLPGPWQRRTAVRSRMDASVTRVVRALADTLSRVDARRDQLPRTSRESIPVAAVRELWQSYIASFNRVRDGVIDSALPGETSCEAVPALADIAVPFDVSRASEPRPQVVTDRGPLESR